MTPSRRFGTAPAAGWDFWRIDMARETGLMMDAPPGPAPALVEPPPDFQLAQRLVQNTAAAITRKCKEAVRVYYETLLKLAAGETTEDSLGDDFQRAIGLLRKSPGQIQADISEARKIISAKQWLSSHEEQSVKREITAVATKIAGYDKEIHDTIARVRSRAAPHHARLAELQRIEMSFTNNQYQAKAWDRWLEGRFEPAPETLDRIRNAL